MYTVVTSTIFFMAIFNKYITIRYWWITHTNISILICPLQFSIVLDVFHTIDISGIAQCHCLDTLCTKHCRPRVTLSSLLAPQIVTTYGATNDDPVGNMATLGLQWIYINGSTRVNCWHMYRFYRAVQKDFCQPCGLAEADSISITYE